MDYYPLSDLLYRTVALTNDPAEGDVALVEAYDTDAYGNTLIFDDPGPDEAWFTDDDVPTDAPLCPFIFTGRRYDPETQIYYYRARYYQPQLGRFISRDPIGYADGTGLYEYLRSTPHNGQDPAGLLGPLPPWMQHIQPWIEPSLSTDPIVEILPTHTARVLVWPKKVTRECTRDIEGQTDQEITISNTRRLPAVGSCGGGMRLEQQTTVGDVTRRTVICSCDYSRAADSSQASPKWDVCCRWKTLQSCTSTSEPVFEETWAFRKVPMSWQDLMREEADRHIKDEMLHQIFGPREPPAGA